ncbi:MAG: hypothetical protein R6V67_01555 [Spirochaetia bacterium]
MVKRAPTFSFGGPFPSATYQIEEGQNEQLAYPFLKGALLQILNVKVLVLGISCRRFESA